MNIKNSISSRIESKLLVLLGTLFVLLPANPFNSKFAFRDSGVFLYVGWRILNGEIPYVDIWDHKPPVIFYINALGLLLTSNSRWGVWIIEFISLFIAAYFGYKLINNIFGKYPAIISTFIWLYTLVFLIGNGNYTEEYVLPLQFISLYLFYYAEMKKKSVLVYFFIGILGGLAFFTKQISIGIWIAITIFFVITGIKNKEIKQSSKAILYILFGSLLVSIIICGYFYVNGALYEFWDAAFIYNFKYSIQKVSSLNIRLWNLLNVSFISKMGFFQITSLGLALFVVLHKKWRIDLHNSTISLLLVGLINFPLELLFINIPGSTFDHYFMTILPVMALFSGFLFFIIDSKISQFQNLLKLEKVLLIIVSIGLLTFGGINDYWRINKSLKEKPNEALINYVIENTDKDDTILVWGAETMINFYSQRNSPTRFVYQYPLYRKGYTSEEKIIEILNDIINNKPKIIINSMRADYPIFFFPISTNEIEEKLNFIGSMYMKSDEINYWDIYELSPD